MSSAQVIREARRRVGLTQQQLADRLESTQSIIARWEAGKVEPSFSTLREIVRACGLELELSIRELDSDQWALVEANLRLTPEQRLDQLVNAVAFIQAGQTQIGRTSG